MGRDQNPFPLSSWKQARFYGKWFHVEEAAVTVHVKDVTSCRIWIDGPFGSICVIQPVGQTLHENHGALVLTYKAKVGTPAS